ncbi:Zn-dependent hydrolase [Rhizobium sp. AG855]|uniref:Zn-dependent hydrolase n=1 Tax=Rhizobium sp. AG855 TaxID=2183898 RepID=UPI000E72814D|nr:Zn-dependent hydrolase [Rhizobium sp. AG855]RKE79404.1 N-carbamoyl-L-amino-acid hydrolase [Rhizobium sp. AG855]
MTRNLLVDASRIAADIDALAAITEPDRPYTRRAFTPLFLEGRRYLEDRFRSAGLETRIDASGNLIGRRAGTEPGRGTLMLGSHSDTVPEGGRFDGIAGVVAALEVARTIAGRGITLSHDLEIVDFLAEEVSIFGVSCIGSRGMAGVMPVEWLGRQAGDLSLEEGLVMVGGDPSVSAARTDIRAFLELHIEQGPVLEEARLDIGVVTAIAGITRIEVIVTGRADHAGTTPMTGRLDALSAAARLVLAIERLGKELASGPGHFAATVGEFEIEPNAANVVPSRVRMLLDVRAELRPDIDRFRAGLGEAVDAVAQETGVAIATPKLLSDNPATPMHSLAINALEAACHATGASHRRMASGAGHDAAFMARICPAGMVFIPCAGGRSHAPEEWADNADITLGAAVLLDAILRLDDDLKETEDGTHTD